MSVDPWKWGDENSDQDWNNGWPNPDFQHNKIGSGFGGNPGVYSGGSNNNSQPSMSSQVGHRHGGWRGQPPPQPNSTADYFSSKPPPPSTVNNNPFPEVENKEIAPPDHNQLGKHQPLKLGSKQGHPGGGRSGGMHGGAHFGNMQQVPNAAPPMFPHPPDNHHHAPPPQPPYNADQVLPTPSNQPHHYFTDNRKDFFQTSEQPNSWSYFDQMRTPMPKPPNGPPPPLNSQQPQSLPPEASDPPPNNFFQDPSRPPQQEPQSLNYFQMQDKMDNYQNSNDVTPREPPEVQRSPQHDLPSQNTPFGLTDQVSSKPNLPPEKEVTKQLDHYSRNQFDDRPPSYVQDDSTSRGHSQFGEEANQPKPKDEKMERYGPQGFEDNAVAPKSQEWNRAASSPSQAPLEEFERPESQTNKHPGFQRQVSDDRTGSKEWSNQFPSQIERPGSREWSGPPPPTDRHSMREWSAPPMPLSQDRPMSREHSLPPPPMHHDRTGSQEWRGSQHIPHGERPGSQGREWSGPFPPENVGSQEKLLGHQRTGSLGSDRSGSLGRDRSSSERSGSSRNNTDSTSARNESATSRSDLRTESTGSRNELMRSRQDQPTLQSEPLIPQVDGSVSRPDRVPSRSPGAGEDRSSPPSRPDNLESLPPESNITQQMNQLTLQSKDKMGDCPLDRNEYLETSQLSNQESVETDMRGSRHPPSDSVRNSHRGERREVVGEAEPLGGRVVVGHTTPTTTPPPHNHSDEVEGGGSGSMERMVPGERREQGSRNNRSSRRRNHHRRESSFEEDDQDYSSDNRRGHRDDYRRDERHRKKRGQDHRSSDYMSDEDYEIDRRAYSRRDRRGRDRDRDREREYEPEYRRDYYRDDREIRRTGRGGREYFRYDDDEYSYRERSRPSSRSGSDYRRTNLEYQSRNQSRHYYNPALALGGREYQSHPEYFEMLRKSNPVLYAIWYQDYMRKLQDTATSAFTQSDRASIHSGQSSGNRLQVSTPSQVLDSNVGNVDSFEDYSPRLFSTPHVRGNYDGQGRLLMVNACSPLDGQQASVDLLSVEPVDEDPAVKEFLETPGPFIPGVTHRSSVLQYLRKMSDQAVKSSEKLLYDLVHLIVKSNGKPDAGDISELLLESYRSSKGDRRDEWDPDPSIQSISHQEMLSTFRNLLHQGNKQEALEWAMKHNGWGHALFLASKMDSRTQNRVAGEFARSLAPSDPLSTLYQVMSGGVPAAATACSDRRWADWRPHLAMVLSNLTDKSSKDLATVTTLADGLASRGRLFAAHSCYIIAQVMFGEVYRAEGPVLLGCSDHMSSSQTVAQSPFDLFNYRSFLLTLCYEYAIKQGQPNFFIASLQRFKLLVAWKLVEWGRGRAALLYCELLASELLLPKMNLTPMNQDLVHLVVELSFGLKSLDPSSAHASTDLSSCPDPDWLQQLRQLASTFPQEETEPVSQPIYNQPEQPPYPNFEAAPQVPMYRTGGSMDYGNQMRPDEGSVMPLPEQQSQSLEPPTSSSTPSKQGDVQHVSHSMQQGMQSLPPVQQGMQSLPPMQQGMQSLPSMQQGMQSLPPMQQGMQSLSAMQPPMQLPMQQPQPTSLPPVASHNSYPQPNFSSQPPSFTGYEESGTTEVDHPVEPAGLMKSGGWEPEKNAELPSLAPNKANSFFHASENLLQDVNEAGKVAAKPSAIPPASSNNDAQKKPESSNGSGGGSWLGGLLGKLSMKPKNEMILPDDKDKKIVFDPKQNKWVDRDKQGTDAAKELKPPPMSGPMGMPSMNPSMPPSNPGIPPNNPGMPLTNPSLPPNNSTNKYKLQKGKSMKSNYVDILSNSGGSCKVKGGMDQMLPPMAPTSHPDAPNPNYFVPQPVDGSDNQGPYQMQNDSYQGQISRSSSMSSLSREVQHYMDRPQHRRNSHRPNKFQMPAHSVPTMYNPANFQS